MRLEIEDSETLAKTLWTRVKTLCRAKKRFRGPPEQECVSFDIWPEHLQECLTLERGQQVMVRNETLYLNPQTVFRTFKHIFLQKDSVKFAYLRAIFEQIKPKLCVTWFDNNELFHVLSNRFTQATWIAIQNSWRYPGLEAPMHGDKNYKSILLCFGQNEVEGFARDRVHFSKIKPVGNTKSRMISFAQKGTKFDVAFVSQNPFLLPEFVLNSYSENQMPDVSRYLQPEVEFEALASQIKQGQSLYRPTEDQLSAMELDAIRKVYWESLSYFVRATRTLGLEACAITRPLPADINFDEVAFWSSLQIEPWTTPRSVPRKMPRATLTIAVSSTLILDLMGTNATAIILKPRLLGFETQHPPNESLWSNCSFSQFLSRLQVTLLNFESVSNKSVSYYVHDTAVDQSSPYNLIKEEIEAVRRKLIC